MTAEARPVLKNPVPLYVVGLFSMGYVDFYIFLMPLYCLSLGMSAGEVGLIVGARSALAVFLSIHIGVLMDRFGTRRVTLFFVWIGICLPTARYAAPSVGLHQLFRADDDPGGGRDDGNHVPAHRHQWRTVLALYRLSRRDRADRHLDRHPVRRDRNSQRLRLAVRRTGDALRRSTEDDAERHRIVDPVHLRHAVSRRHLCAAVPGPGGARLAAGRRPADDFLGAGQSTPALPPGAGRRPAPDDAPAVPESHPAELGRR